MDSYLQKGVKLKGVLHIKGTVHIEGDFEGELVAEDHLIIGKGGLVTGDIETYDITNMGSIKGNINAENKVSLLADSHLVGDIKTYQFVVEEGSNFEGRCKMVQTPPKSPATPPRKFKRERQKQPVLAQGVMSDGSAGSGENPELFPDPALISE